MPTYVLTNSEGDRQVVDSSSTNGELAALLDSGYDFADESADLTVAMLSDDGHGRQTVDHVPARNVTAYQRDMSQATGRRPMIITADSGVREYVDNMRNQEARAQRVRELSNSWEGLGVGIGTGALAPFIAAGQGIRALQGREPAEELFGYNLSEVGEARPFSQVAGNILGMVGTGGAGAIGGAGIRASQFAGRLGANRAGQVAAGLAVEEALWTTGSTLPLAMMEGQPQLSAEALLGGAAFGGAVGLVTGPYMRAAWRARRAGEQQIFREVAATPGQGPMQQLIELNRNPPMQHGTQAVSNPRADELASLMNRLGLFPTALEREAGAPFLGRAGVAAHRFMHDAVFRRSRLRSWAHGLSDQDIDRYMDEQFIRDNTIPVSSTNQAVQSVETMSQAIRDELLLPRIRRAINYHRDATQGIENLQTEAYREMVRSSPGNARRNLGELEEGINSMLIGGIRGNLPQDRQAALDYLNEAVGGRPVSSAADRAHRLRLALEGNVATDQVGRAPGLDDFSQPTRELIKRLTAISGNLWHNVRRTDLSEADRAEILFDNMLKVRSITEQLEQSGEVPTAALFNQNLSDAFEGRRDFAELNTNAEPSQRALFSEEVHNRFMTINASYALQKRGGSLQRLLEKFEQGDVRFNEDTIELSGDRVRKAFETRALKSAEEYDRFVHELRRDIEDVDRMSNELRLMLGDTDADDIIEQSKIWSNEQLDEYARIMGNRGRFARDSMEASNQVPSSLASHAFAQAFGGFVGTLIDPLLGWVTGGAAAVASLAMREVDKNPARAMMMQGRMRNQLLDYNRRLESGAAEVGKKMRLGARLVRAGGRAARGTRIAGRGLGFAILDENISQRERIEQYNAIRDRFNTLANDPIALADELEMSFSTVDSVSPEVAHYMRERSVAGVQYMSANLAPATTDPLSEQVISVPPSMAEMDAFLRRFRAIQDPLSVLDDLANGIVTSEGSETVRIVYPNIMADISASIGEEIAKMGPDAAHIPYQMRTNLSLLVGAPTHTTLEGSFVRAMNDRFAQTPQQAAAQGLSRVRTRKIDVAGGFMTEAQALSER